MQQNEILSIKLSETVLSQKTIEACKSYGIETIGDLVSHSVPELYRMGRLGKYSINSLKALVDLYKLSFKDSYPATLTNEEKVAKAMQILQQKRELFAINILNGICHGALDDLIKSSDAPSAIVKMAVRMADTLIGELYPIKEGKEDGSNE